jgi:hypothetical protein
MGRPRSLLSALFHRKFLQEVSRGGHSCARDTTGGLLPCGGVSSGRRTALGPGRRRRPVATRHPPRARGTPKIPPFAAPRILRRRAELSWPVPLEGSVAPPPPSPPLGGGPTSPAKGPGVLAGSLRSRRARRRTSRFGGAGLPRELAEDEDGGREVDPPRGIGWPPRRTPTSYGRRRRGSSSGPCRRESHPDAREPSQARGAP